MPRRTSSQENAMQPSPEPEQQAAIQDTGFKDCQLPAYVMPKFTGILSVTESKVKLVDTGDRTYAYDMDIQREVKERIRLLRSSAEAENLQLAPLYFANDADQLDKIAQKLRSQGYTELTLMC